MENHNFYWENSLEMVFFEYYVELPEGIDLAKTLWDIEDHHEFRRVIGSHCIPSVDH